MFIELVFLFYTQVNRIIFWFRMSKQSSVYGQLYTSQCFLQTRGPGTLMNLSILTPFFIEYGFYYPNLNRTKKVENWNWNWTEHIVLQISSWENRYLLVSLSVRTALHLQHLMIQFYHYKMIYIIISCGWQLILQ